MPQDSQGGGHCPLLLQGMIHGDLIQNWYEKLIGAEIFSQDDVDFVEMYNINEDPYQLTNLAWSEEEEENNSEAQSRIAQLRNCHGWRQCLN